MTHDLRILYFVQHVQNQEKKISKYLFLYYTPLLNNISLLLLPLKYTGFYIIHNIFRTTTGFNGSPIRRWRTSELYMARNNMRIILQIVDAEFANAHLHGRSIRDRRAFNENGTCCNNMSIRRADVHAGISRCIPPDIFVICIAHFQRKSF